MKLKRDQNTCYWCGNTRGPHPWCVFPVNSKVCTKCCGNDHFVRVCLEQSTQLQKPQQYQSPRYRGRCRSNRDGRGYQNYRINHQQQHQHPQPIHALSDAENEFNTDNYENMVPWNRKGKKFTILYLGLLINTL